MPFLPPNQQRQSTEGSALKEYLVKYLSPFGLEVFDGLLSMALCTCSKNLTVITLFVGHHYTVHFVDRTKAHILGFQGIFISKVNAGGAAEKAGVAVYDKLLSVSKHYQ